MLKLESYKLFKRKIVMVVITGIFLIVLLQEISTIREYKYYQKDIELMDKYKGIYTDLNFTRFYKDAKKVLDKQEISYYKLGFYIDIDNVLGGNPLFYHPLHRVVHHNSFTNTTWPHQYQCPPRIF